jgi:hypothetical protein
MEAAVKGRFLRGRASRFGVTRRSLVTSSNEIVRSAGWFLKLDLAPGKLFPQFLYTSLGYVKGDA